MTQTTLQGNTPIQEWYDSRRLEYELTARRLEKTRQTFMHADTDKAVRMLDMSYANAVISQQCAVNKHEAGWIHWVNTGEIPEYVVYSNQKTRWLNNTNHIHKINAVSMLHSGKDLDKVHEYLETHFTGLGLMKAAFTLAMLGFTDRMCIDTNVTQVTGIEVRSLNNLSQYLNKCEEICEKFDMGVPPFLTQWILFDFNRGNHSTHEVWFRELGTWVDINDTGKDKHM